MSILKETMLSSKRNERCYFTTMQIQGNIGSMKLAIMQPYFFPYIGYFQLINAVDRFILYDNVKYIKSGWINRNRILEINKEPVYITIPVKNNGNLSRICDVIVDNDKKWKQSILNIIYYNYKKSWFFDEVFPVLESSLNKDTEYLTDINCATIRQISEFLDISTEIISDVSNYESLEKELCRSDSDIITFYSREQNLKDVKSIRIICICKNEHADKYINAIGGQVLYDKQVFARNGIDLKFINTLSYSYKQNSRQFIPGLSIVDVMMNCGKEGTKNLLSNFELI